MRKPVMMFAFSSLLPLLSLIIHPPGVGLSGVTVWRPHHYKAIRELFFLFFFLSIKCCHALRYDAFSRSKSKRNQ